MSTQPPSLRELLRMSSETANLTLTNARPSACVECHRTITILPLRYGVVSGTDPATLAQLAPALPAHLGKQLTPPLRHSRYAVRSIREGYVYIFLQRLGKAFVCEAAYRACDSGLLQAVWPYDPGVPIPGIAALGGWTVQVGDPEDVDEARLLFTPDPLSPEMVDRYRDNPVYRNRLQKFDLRILVNSCGLFDDAITPSNVAGTVAEFLAADNPAARNLLEKQAFPPFRNALVPGDEPRSMGSIYQNALESLMGGGGVALVLDDPIGIVQELNAWRNDAIEMNLPWLATVDAQGLSNERKYIVAEALDDVKAAMQAGYVKKQVDKAAARLESAKDRQMRDLARFGISLDDLEAQKARYDPERVRTQAEADKDSAFTPYEAMLDWPAKTRIQADFCALDRKAQEAMDKRAADHLAWLDSELLERALDLYDRKQPVWGQAFAAQIAQCVLGMNGCPQGAARLAAWWADTRIAKQNLVGRALTRNQTDIEAETRIAFAKAQAAQALTAENMVEVLDSTSVWFEKVADLFTKADATVEAAIAAGSCRWFDAQRLKLVLSLFSSLHQYLMTAVPGNALDRRLLAPMLGFVHAGLGKATTRLRMRDLAAAGLTANPNRVAGQVNSHIGKVRDNLAAEFQNGGGKFYQIRGGVIMALIEGIVLGIKYFNKDNGDKEKLEYKAAFLITTAAGIELAALGVQSVATRFAPTGVVGRGAAISLGGLRLVGGSLATVGGVMLASIDYEDAAKAYDSDYRVLGHAYFARAVVSFGLSGLAGLVSLSYSGPLLRFLVGASSRSLLVLAIENFAASGLVPVFLRLIGIGSFITIGISVAIIFLSPNEMEEWCWHSCLRDWESGKLLKPFKDQETELKKLYESLKAVN
ncbi:MAG: T6SS effector BTH_I2691 family protein [Pseudomonas sp.]